MTTTPVPTPFHLAPAGTAVQRLLLLSFHFPPASTAGALRWQKLAAHAADAGYGLDVVTLPREAAPGVDLTRLEGLPAGTRLYGVHPVKLVVDRIEDAVWSWLRRFRRGPRSTSAVTTAKGTWRPPRPGSLGREELTLRTRQDLRRAYHAWRLNRQDESWATAAAHAGERIATTDHAAVITCGPPHMIHSAGSRLARALGVPHVIDMRDPWSLVERLPEGMASPIWLALAKRFEAPAVRDAALVVMNTEPARDAMRAEYPGLADRIIAVMNGYDVEPLPDATGDGCFTIAYAGTVYLDRNPRPLFRAVRRLQQEFGLTDRQVGIELMGNVHQYEGRSLEALAADEGIADLVRLHPPGPRAQALAFLARAAVLVSLPQDSEMAIPSKVFEYLRFPAWVLALAEPGSATALALRATRADVVSADDEDGLYRVLRDRFLQHREGIRPEPEPAGGPLSRAAQARILFDALDRCLARPVESRPRGTRRNVRATVTPSGS